MAVLDFTKLFEIHADVSKYQIGATITQRGKPIAFFSRKLTGAQLLYTVTEKALLAIIATLKEFRHILLGQRIKIHTDHKNLMAQHLDNHRVMRWLLYMAEYSPELEYIKGIDNIVADVLS